MNFLKIVLPLIFLSLLSSLFGCSSAGVECSNNSDCGEGYLCSGGICVVSTGGLEGDSSKRDAGNRDPSGVMGDLHLEELGPEKSSRESPSSEAIPDYSPSLPPVSSRIILFNLGGGRLSSNSYILTGSLQARALSDRNLEIKSSRYRIFHGIASFAN